VKIAVKKKNTLISLGQMTEITMIMLRTDYSEILFSKTKFSAHALQNILFHCCKKSIF
jgi:hypothetical protein